MENGKLETGNGRPVNWPVSHFQFSISSVVIGSLLCTLTWGGGGLGRRPRVSGRAPLAHGGRRDYYAGRALGILPLYYSAVLVATVLSAVRLSDLVRGLPYLAFLNAVGLTIPMLPYTRDWWSLATEVQFYLVLPLLPLFLRTRFG